MHQGLKKISSGNILNYKEIIKLVEKTYDTEKMLKMIIGDVWKNSSSDEQKQLINVFEKYISINYIKRFSKIEEPVFQFLENKNVANFLMIKTQLVLKQNEKIPISYLLTKKGEKWKIFDVLLAGSVSEIATKKSEFNAFLKDGKIDSLLEALRKKNTLLISKISTFEKMELLILNESIILVETTLHLDRHHPAKLIVMMFYNYLLPQPGALGPPNSVLTHPG